MKAKEIFGLAVRLLGLFFIYLAARELPVLFTQPADKTVVQILLTAAFFAGVGWWLIGGAPLLLKRAYPEANKQQQGGEISSQTAKADA
jgi:hypothetical protein